MVDLGQDAHGVKVPVLVRTSNDHVHRRQIGQFNFICKGAIKTPGHQRKTNMILDPTAPDPFESKMVEVRPSNIVGAHEGLFAR